MTRFRPAFLPWPRGLAWAVWLLALLAPLDGLGQVGAGEVHFGIKLRAGGRYDDVRMCVGSPAGVKGGPALDVSFFTQVGLSDRVALAFDLPVVRPLLFGAAFSMLQFEPSVQLEFRTTLGDNRQLVVGPLVGLSLHHGPDYRSEPRGEDRRPAFFALGPIVGGYLGLDLERPDGSFDLTLGLTPYVTPLFALGDPEEHRGLVAGGLLDAGFRFR